MTHLPRARHLPLLQRGAAIAGVRRVCLVCPGPAAPSRAYRPFPSLSRRAPGPAPRTMAAYKPVVVQACPKLGERITQDTLYWRGYKVGDSGPE